MRNVLACLVEIDPHADTLFNLHSVLLDFPFLFAGFCCWKRWEASVVGKSGNAIKLTLILPIDNILTINIWSDFSCQLIDLIFEVRVLFARMQAFIYGGLELVGLWTSSHPVSFYCSFQFLPCHCWPRVPVCTTPVLCNPQAHLNLLVGCPVPFWTSPAMACHISSSALVVIVIITVGRARCTRRFYISNPFCKLQCPWYILSRWSRGCIFCPCHVPVPFLSHSPVITIKFPLLGRII